VKKVLSILLVIVILTNSVGITFLFLQQRSNIKSEFRNFLKNTIDKSELVKIVISKINSKQYLFHKTDKDEFKYRGKMFDIVRQYETKDSIYYYCINDEKEEKLLIQFSEILKSTLDGNKNIKKSFNNFFKYFSFVFMERLENKLFPVPSEFINIKNSVLPLTEFFRNITPPPKIFFR
jgi:hypothetical protein